MVHMFMDYHPCPKGKGLDRLYFYQDSRASQEYQTLFRATMKTINPFQRLVYDFKNHHPRPNALGRRSISRQIGSTVVAGSLPASLLFNGMAHGFAFRSEEHTSELQSLMRISYAVFCLKKKKQIQ